MYEVTINTVMNGFIVKVGCQTLVFQKRKTLIKELNRFLKNPDKMEKEYMEKYGPNATQTGAVTTTGSYGMADSSFGPSRSEEVAVEVSNALAGVPMPTNR